MYNTAPVERNAHNHVYANQLSDLPADMASFQRDFIKVNASALKDGGSTKGLVRGLALRKMMLDLGARGLSPSKVKVLDAGCGQGDLTLYLASLGFNVIAIDLSEVAIACLEKRAEALHLSDRITGHACSLEDTPLRDGSVDVIIGFASLHHFIKYADVAPEFNRILKPRARAYFADSFGENPIYKVFHDKEKMDRLGDVTLTRRCIGEFFKSGFRTNLFPTDRFSMLDKLYGRIHPQSAGRTRRMLSALHYKLDRLVPMDSSMALRLSGAVFTQVEKVQEPGKVGIAALPVDDLMRQDPGNMIKT